MELTYSQAYQSALAEEMAVDESIVVLGTDLFIRGGHYAQVKGLGPMYGPNRVLDAPISEAAMVAAGVGGALNGLRPVVDLNFMDFAFGAMDELVNQAAKARYMWGVPVPMVVRATWGVAYGAAQHNNEIESWFVNTPGLMVIAPSNPADVKGLMKSALRSDDPVVVFMHKTLTGVRGEVPEGDYVVPLGSAATPRKGSDITLVTYGGLVPKALSAADAAAQEGVSIEVIDLRTLSPLDLPTILSSVEKTGRLLVVSDSPRAGSVGSWVLAEVAERAHASLKAPPRHLSGCHSPIAHSPVLVRTQVPDAESMTAEAVALARRA
jgi:pyruvate/2-oxoglutarate/acetoin dehydrogenase E1 component